jgi:toxin ParE1/3/4
VKRLVRRAQATQDLENAFDYYLEAANLDVAERLLNEVGDAMAHIARHPGTGSPRYSLLIKGHEFRFWTLNKFPYSVFYFEHDDFIDIIRVLHQSADIPNHLQP